VHPKRLFGVKNNVRCWIFGLASFHRRGVDIFDAVVAALLHVVLKQLHSTGTIGRIPRLSDTIKLDVVIEAVDCTLAKWTRGRFTADNIPSLKSRPPAMASGYRGTAAIP
jgi:hypothetical protein